MLRRWAVVALSTAAAQVVAFLPIVLLAHRLSAAEVGRYAFAYTVVSIAGIAAMAGTRSPVVRRLASSGTLPVAPAALHWGKAVSALVAAVASSALVAGPGQAAGLAATAAGLAAAAYVVGDYLDSIALGRERIGAFAAANLSAAMVPVAGLVAFAGHLTVTTSLAALVGSYVCRLTVYSLLGIGRGEPDPQDGQPLVAWARRECCPFWWQTLLAVAGTQLPIVLVRARGGLEDVAHFDAANKVALALALVISSLSMVLLPRLAALGDVAGRALFERVLVLGTAGFALIAAVVSAGAALLVELLYGNAFAASVPVLRLQVWVAAAAIVFNVMGTAMMALGHERSLARLSTAYTAILIGAVTVGAGWGAAGAAAGFAVAGVLNLGYHLVVFARVTGWVVPRAVIGGFVTAAAWSVLVAPHLPLLAGFVLPVVVVGSLGWRLRVVQAQHSLAPVGVTS